MEIIIARHGQSVANANKIFAGQKNYPLTPLGKRQARQNSEKVAAEPFGAVFVSDLGRAYATFKRLKPKSSKIVVTPLLRERGLGEIEGNDPRAFGLGHDFEEKFYKRDEEFHKKHGMETLEDTLKRADEAIRLIKATKADKVLVVAHGTFNSYLISRLLGESEEKLVYSPQKNDELHYVKLDNYGRPVQAILDWQGKKPIDRLKKKK